MEYDLLLSKIKILESCTTPSVRSGSQNGHNKKRGSRAKRLNDLEKRKVEVTPIEQCVSLKTRKLLESLRESSIISQWKKPASLELTKQTSFSYRREFDDISDQAMVSKYLPRTPEEYSNKTNIQPDSPHKDILYFSDADNKSSYSDSKEDGKYRLSSELENQNKSTTSSLSS